MKFAVIGEVLGNDRLLATLLHRLVQRGIGPRAIVSLGNLIGPFGDSLRCLHVARDFAVCLRGSLERVLLGQTIGALYPSVQETISDLQQSLPREMLESVAEWPASVVSAPYAFVDSPETELRVPLDCHLRFVAAQASYWVPAEPVPYLAHSRRSREIWYNADDHFATREVILPQPEEEWEFTVPGILPATIYLGSHADFGAVRDLDTDGGQRQLAAWIVDDRFLRFIAQQHDRRWEEFSARPR